MWEGGGLSENKGEEERESDKAITTKYKRTVLKVSLWQFCFTRWKMAD